MGFVNARWALLIQDGHPIAFESRKVEPAESKYSTYDKNISMVVHAVKIWKHYLTGFKVIIISGLDE